MRSSALSIVVSFVLAFTLGSCERIELDDRSGMGSPSRTPARITHVIDGDTVRAIVDGDEVTIRLIGIDTPETDGPYTDLECYGEEATAYTRGRLDDQQIGLEFDVERIDRYDRMLAYLWLGDELVNESILAQGAGVLLTIPPNVAHVERFEDAQRAAREDERGLWGACP